MCTSMLAVKRIRSEGLSERIRSEGLSEHIRSEGLSERIRSEGLSDVSSAEDFSSNFSIAEQSMKSLWPSQILHALIVQKHS